MFFVCLFVCLFVVVFFEILKKKGSVVVAMSDLVHDVKTLFGLR